MYVMWKKKQIHEDAMKMYLDQNYCQKAGENGEDAIREVMTSAEERTDKRRH